MSATIDEREAWGLIRAVAPPDPGDAGTFRFTAGSTDAWLELDADGAWSTSHSLTDEARALIDLFLPLQLAGDLVIGQLGQSLDGRIATDAGASHYITGPRDITRLHRVRALVDAVLVGANTVASDDPRLTVRAVDGDDPVRVVLDPDGRLDRTLRVFSDGAAPTLVVRRQGEDRCEVGEEDEILIPELHGRGLDVHRLLEALRERGLRRVLVEGGGRTVSSFLRAGALDRLHITVAPMIIGSGRPSITLDPILTLDGALRPRCRAFRLGDDVLFDLDLRARPT